MRRHAGRCEHGSRLPVVFEGLCERYDGNVAADWHDAIGAARTAAKHRTRGHRRYNLLVLCVDSPTGRGSTRRVG